MPDNAKVRALAAPFATRFILRGGEDVAGPVGAAFGVEPPTRPLASAAEGPRAALWLGPDEWLLIAEDEPADLASRLEAALAGVFHALVDVSHRQVAIEVAGPGAARLLAAGVPLDLDLVGFPGRDGDADAVAEGGDHALAARGGTVLAGCGPVVRALRGGGVDAVGGGSGGGVEVAE